MYGARMHRSSDRAAHPVTLRLEAFTAWAAEQQLVGDGPQAAAIGVDRSIMSRVRRGQLGPSPRFIAGVVIATGKPFDDMFAIPGAETGGQK